jgi:hypothetical protein
MNGDQAEMEGNMGENRWVFGDWWVLLNKELAEIGYGEALYGDARYFHTANYSATTAARVIAERRNRPATQALPEVSRASHYS